MNAAESLVAQLADARLTTVQWSPDGRDLDLVVATAEGTLRVRCTAVTGLDLDLHYRRNASGALHACGCELERTTSGRWSLHWMFPPQGVIRLECADVALVDAAADASS